VKSIGVSTRHPGEHREDQGSNAVSELTVEQSAAVKAAMQSELQGVDLTKQVAIIPDPLASAIMTVWGEDRSDLAASRWREMSLVS
jgi:hypothetical protein